MNPFAHNSHLSNPSVPGIHTHSVTGHFITPHFTSHGTALVQGHMVHSHLSHNPGFGGGDHHS